MIREIYGQGVDYIDVFVNKLLVSETCSSNLVGSSITCPSSAKQQHIATAKHNATLVTRQKIYKE